jgi:hypothetical protein
MKFQRKDGDSFPQCERLAHAALPCARWRMICNRLAILLLLLGLTGLSATAKDGQYHRVSNLEHESSLATKMNVPPPAANFSVQPLRTVARIVIEEPRQILFPRIEAEPPVAESIGVTVAMQHRSPPDSLQ